MTSDNDRSGHHRPLRGRTEPRLATPALRKLTRRTSRGFAVIDFAASLGLALMPWQKSAFVRGLELRPGGGYRYQVVMVLASRQNGKSTLPQVLSLWRMLHDGARTVLGTSTNLDYARESWEGAVELAEDHLDGEVQRVLRGAINTQMKMRNGARYKIAAANRRGGRSLSVDLGIADELREHTSWEAWGALSGTTTARANPQIWALSNAGDDASVVLNAQRQAALSFIESGEGDDTLGLFEWSGEDGCDLDDRGAWQQANPALGYTITEATLISKMSSLPPAVFRTEHLCQRVAAMDGAVDLAAWREAADAGTLDSVRDRVALCVDVSLDLAHVTLVAAAVLGDGRARVEVVDAWDSVAAARAALPGWLAKTKPQALGWFPNGPAASLAADLRGARRSEPIKGEEVSAVCLGLSEQVLARRVLHSGDPLLAAQLDGTAKAWTGDGWRFARRGRAHCDAVYALAGALHLARTLPVSVGKPRLIVAQ